MILTFETDLYQEKKQIAAAGNHISFFSAMEKASEANEPKRNELLLQCGAFFVIVAFKKITWQNTEYQLPSAAPLKKVRWLYFGATDHS